MLGWALGNLPGSNPQIRRYCVLGAVLPDVDGIGFFFSPTAYDQYHHTFGHNLVAAGLFMLFMAWRCRSWTALAFGALAFGSHLATDAGLSGWPVYLFYPFSGRAFFLSHSVGLSHPINIHLIYVGYVVVIALVVVCRRTPLELISPKLDRLVVSPLRAHPNACHVCGRGSNLGCTVCGRPMCLRHTRLRVSLDTVCEECTRERA
ncbi:MAG TPA: metal-dependent hydrolase [Verrucomicrobiota bacterium]|nr:metal-dependent hydrolase [Verrucomicrobiota bacterium]HNU52139.1 metal-dependent hydrolase [Verrucomicrobiota bacterium]